MSESHTSTVLITGAAQRVGAAIARHLAGKGWHLLLHYRSSHDEAETLATELRGFGVQVGLAQADLAHPEAAETIFAAAEALPPVTTLIHNASQFEREPWAELSAASLESHLAINLQTPLLLTHEFARRFPKGEYPGNVICLLDGTCGWSISPTFFAYSVSRLGLEKTIPLLATSLAPHIRINGIALGPTLPGKQDKEHTFAKMEWVSPLKRTSHPGEVCDVVDYLLKADGMTGQTINLSGGMQLGFMHQPD